MNKRTFTRTQSGQGLVEYALILAIVAIGAILILKLLGLAVERIFGITTASLGGKAQSAGAEIINITGADCYVISVGSSYAGGAFAATGYTGYFLKVDTNVPFDQLYTAGTEQDPMMGIFSPQTEIVAPPAISHITFSKDIAPFADGGLCPRTSVVQSLRGAIAVGPVNVMVIP
jgi:Flp pilus assembly pilin Flp